MTVCISYFFSDDGNHTFLQYACDHGYDDIVKYLLGQFNSVTQIHRKYYFDMKILCEIIIFWVET